MRRLRATILRAARSRLSVLIHGPTGSGKELVARGLHLASGRTGEFVAFNVCAVSDSMFEDALFGHVKGAFTGALGETAGYLAEANGGSLFLDEINGLPLPAQAKLLRVIETGTYRSVGAARDRCSDFRVLAAANDSLNTAIARGPFRTDLYYRLSGIVIEVPPLSERIEDIALLSAHLLSTDQSTARYQLSAGAICRLGEHDWPGNVRELKHTLERASLAADGLVINAGDIAGALVTRLADTGPSVFHNTERERMMELLENCAWDTARLAFNLGVHRTTVYRRMQRLGITLPVIRDRVTEVVLHG
jgi:DNA-binding NtrC family response regulator